VQKKQILDDCPFCRRHRAIPLAQWKELEANALREKMQEAETKPDDPEAMLQLLGTMIGFRRMPDALKLADVLEADFPDNLEVQIQLGTWHASEGRAEKAGPCFHRVFKLDPQNLYAKKMIALECIDKGDISRARELLRGMDEPGPNQSPQAMLALADAYQRQSDHGEALKCFQTVLNMYPPYGQDKSLRKKILESERALGVVDSLLPKKQRKLGPLVALAAVVPFCIVVPLAWNFFKARNQPLHIVNQLNVPVKVTIDGGKPIEVTARNRREATVAEGDHRAIVQQIGEPDDAIDFRVENGFFERFSGNSVFVLNPGKAGVILKEAISYFPKDRPMPNDNVNFEIIFGEKSFTFREVDYIFQEPPKEINGGDSGTKVVTKSAINVCDENPMAILSVFPLGTPPGRLADFVESQLKQHDDDESLLRSYLSLSAAANQIDRCRDYLAEGLKKRPIRIEWHRNYQDACRMTGREVEAEAEYRKMLETDPRDSTLLYLTGRIVADPKQQQRLFEQSAEADPQNAYPRYALAYDYSLVGDFSKALPLAKEACRIKPEHPHMELLLFEVRFALKEYATMERELKEQLNASPLNMTVMERLMQIQAAQGALDRARETQHSYAEAFSKSELAKISGNFADITEQTLLLLHYLENDMQAILNESPGSQNAIHAAAEKFIAHLELGKIVEAEADLAGSRESSEKFPSQSALLLSLAWSRKGNAEKADVWRDKALETMKAGSDEEKRAASILEQKKGDLEGTNGLSFDMTFKSVWLAALADVSEEHRGELLDLAEKLNVNTYFPHRFLKHTIEEMKAGK
jgi:tetratricopeptide (TPR) repeat protein